MKRLIAFFILIPLLAFGCCQVPMYVIGDIERAHTTLYIAGQAQHATTETQFFKCTKDDFRTQSCASMRAHCYNQHEWKGEASHTLVEPIHIAPITPPKIDPIRIEDW